MTVMLTPQQVQYFHAFGFLVIRNVLTPQDLEPIGQEFEIGMAEAEADHACRGAGEREQLVWSNLHPDMPFATGLLEDARCAGVAEQLFGPDVVGLTSGASHFAGTQSPWHPDTQDKNLFGFKLAFYLQPLDADSGALRFLPGSHKAPYYDDLFEVLWPNGDTTGHHVNVPDYPAFVCRTNPGDAVAFNFHVWHASWGGSTDRRMVSLQYQKDPTTPDEEASIHKHVQTNEQVMEEFGRDGPFHHPHWVSNPGGSRLRERWIGKLRDWGYIKT
jgi:hypothetical protein